VEDFAQGLTLSKIGAFIDNRLAATVALRDFAWPLDEQNPIETVELRFVEIPFLNMPNPNRLTESIRGTRTELAGTSPGAVAIDELSCTNHPPVFHGWSPPICLHQL
jgi:hypothetical protein